MIAIKNKKTIDYTRLLSLATLLTLVVVALVLILPDISYAANTPGDPGGSTPSQGCAGLKTAVIKCDASGGQNPIVSLLLTVINFIAVGVGLLAVGGIVWGGITLGYSNGNSQRVTEGRDRIANSVVGIIVFLFMYAIIQYLVPGGLFH